jgi:hypothetical protein
MTALMDVDLALMRTIWAMLQSASLCQSHSLINQMQGMSDPMLASGLLECVAPSDNTVSVIGQRSCNTAMRVSR